MVYWRKMTTDEVYDNLYSLSICPVLQRQRTPWSWWRRCRRHHRKWTQTYFAVSPVSISAGVVIGAFEWPPLVGSSPCSSPLVELTTCNDRTCCYWLLNLSRHTYCNQWLYHNITLKTVFKPFLNVSLLFMTVRNVIISFSAIKHVTVTNYGY